MASEHSIVEELQLWLRDFATQRDRFAGTPPPDVQSLDASGLLAAEAAARPVVDQALEHWLEYGAWREEPTGSARFWLWARFEHAYFLLGCLMATDDRRRMLWMPVDDSGLKLGLDSFLLVYSWRFAGARRWCTDLAWMLEMLRLQAHALKGNN